MTGCLTSESPLITDQQAETPVLERYATLIEKQDGKEARLVFRRTGKSYEAREGEQRLIQRFVRFGNPISNKYIVQTEYQDSPSKPSIYLYDLAIISGKNIYEQRIGCATFTQQERSEFGILVSGKLEEPKYLACTFGSYSQLEVALKRIESRISFNTRGSKSVIEK